jgi:pyruvate carboxylase
MKVGVPCVPGTPGPVGSYLEGAAFVEEHGFPGDSDEPYLPGPT